MSENENVRPALEATLRWAKEQGYAKRQVIDLVKSVYETRYADGLEVTDGWEMPKPPREGLIPCFELHGGDGMSLFWWDEAWGKWPSSYTAYDKSQEEGWTVEEHGHTSAYMDTYPLVNPDTGGTNYKQTERALRELGFRG